MRFEIFFLSICVLKSISCNESESSEVRHIEITPYYDTIIFSDVIDIINELNKDFNSQLNIFANSDSESDENVEDLLSEYQHYLDKAQDKRRTYLEKLNQRKNKVPLLRHESFTKTHQPAVDKYNNYYDPNTYYNPNILKIPPTAFDKPLDLFLPLNSRNDGYFSRYLNNSIHETILGKKGSDGIANIEARGDNKPLALPPLYRKPLGDPIKSSCKQCLVQLNPTKLYNNQMNNYPDDNRKIFNQNLQSIDRKIPEHLLEEMKNSANTVNVKIKVDIELPKFLEALGNINNQQQNRDSALEYEDISKESISSIRFPTTTFNFPIPLNMFGYKKSSKIRHDSSPIRKITIHKKKKSRLNGNNNNNKRHRKKLITFHNVKVSSLQTSKPLLKINHNSTVSGNKTVSLNETQIINGTEKTTFNDALNHFSATTKTTDMPSSKNTTQFEDSIYLMVNISNNNDSETDDIHKTGNSIELESSLKPNNSHLNVREKRDLSAQNNNNSIVFKNDTNLRDENIGSTVTTSKMKKQEKLVYSDYDLLYWPSNSQNITASKVKNITDIILERETKKTKLNMTRETIRHNRTVALEQAIFGQVDWNDIDTVAPTFISFVGKYMNGILTFCSQKICHSMKCAKTSCIHRTCLPEKRFNQIGHCSRSNKTDSVASMKSLMDLPSNVVFEIVDILQDKMYGKLYGKVTLCISSKCISFVTSKKMFNKSKCVAKTLNKLGHCTDLKKI